MWARVLCTESFLCPREARGLEWGLNRDVTEARAWAERDRGPRVTRESLTHPGLCWEVQTPAGAPGQGAGVGRPGVAPAQTLELGDLEQVTQPLSLVMIQMSSTSGM